MTLGIAFLCNNIYSQDINKKVIHDKISNVKKQIKDDSLRLTGAVKVHAGYRIFSKNNAKPFEYKISANVNASYRGLKIPISYNFSNGRSLYRLSGPNLSIPKFNNLGVSPTYKWAKLHLGTRTMSFSRYTFDNLRFVGTGLELAPKSFVLKFFNGKIFQSSLSDIQLANNLTIPYKRKAWGLYTGYKTKTSEYTAMIFKADDDINSIIVPSLVPKVKPKANTAVGLSIKQDFVEKIKVSYDWAVSAVTYDQFSQRIDIPTQRSFYNMLGFYVKKESSKYAYAKKFSLAYDDAKGVIGFNYESIDKDYRSLGSLLFDNNFKSYTVTFSKTFIEKLNINSEVGLRQDGINKESFAKAKRWIGNVSTSYALNEKINLNATYSNFRNTEKNYYQTVNSINFDSVSISLLNHNLNLMANFGLDDEKKSVLTLMYSKQISNRIQSDTVNTNSSLNNDLYSINHSLTNDKFNINSAISLMTNSNEILRTRAVMPNISISYTINDKMDVKSNFLYNYIKSGAVSNKTMSINQDFTYIITKKQQINFTNRLIFNSIRTKMGLLEHLIELDYSLKF